MLRRSLRCFAPSLLELRKDRATEVSRLSEVVQADYFRKHVAELGNEPSLEVKGLRHWETCSLVQAGTITNRDIAAALDASLLTFFLHVESRVASLLGGGFYTIGPCGEELLSPIGLHLRSTDPMALHYRHLAVNIGRQLRAVTSKGEDVTLAHLEAIAYGRAKGYTVSKNDPVCGGHHCALGGSGPHDYIVTSTLASQTCPAVGRALGGKLAKMMGHPAPFGDNDYLSFVSTGDGSTSNGHFLSGLNLAKFAQYRKYRVPLLIAVTDNGLCISLKNEGFFAKKFTKDMGIPLYECKGGDTVDIWEKTAEASKFVRERSQPAALIIHEITRRFGHAATDRQNAYLTPQQIQEMQATNDVLGACQQAVEAGVISQDQLIERMDAIWELCKNSFEKAGTEPKITKREEVLTHNNANLVPVPSNWSPQPSAGQMGIQGAKANVMRKHMNRVFDELLAEKIDGKPSDVVYIGEDVTHGGYYLVTEGLLKKHSPLRIADFPPDETSLIGAGMGYSHSGLTPIVELPYAKYLDCGFDMFTEACIMNWLSQSSQPNGLIFRLQGFGRGVFGGNYHTHNILQMPPGLDVVCHSNGASYAASMRYAVQQARKGRVVMFVDCTELLNIRSIPPSPTKQKTDVEFTPCVGPWEFEYTSPTTYRTFDDVSLFKDENSKATSRLLIVSYGGGLISSLQAAHELRLRAANGVDGLSNVAIDVVDSPLLSDVPQGLKDIVPQYDSVLFADMCKEGQHPFASFITSLSAEEPASTAHKAGLFKDMNAVRCVAAPKTYNPLGTTLTFLSDNDIINAALKLVK